MSVCKSDMTPDESTRIRTFEDTVVEPTPATLRGPSLFSHASQVPRIVAWLMLPTIFACSALFIVGQTITMFSLGRATTVHFMSLDEWNVSVRQLPLSRNHQALLPTTKPVEVCENYDAIIARESADFGAPWINSCAAVQSMGVCGFDDRLRVTCCAACGFGVPPHDAIANANKSSTIRGANTNSTVNQRVPSLLSHAVLEIGDHSQEVHEMRSFMPMSFMLSLEQLWATNDPAQRIVATVLFLLSGVWPHLKLLQMSCCWFLPVCSRTRRGILAWTSGLGKFSLVDPLVVMLVMAVFTTGYSLSREASPEMFPTVAAAVAKDMNFKLVNFNSTSSIVGADKLLEERMDRIDFEMGMYALPGVLYFCGGVWISLLLNAVVEYYAARVEEETKLESVVGKCAEHYVDREDGSQRACIFGFGASAVAIAVVALVTVGVGELPMFGREITGRWGAYMQEAQHAQIHKNITQYSIDDIYSDNVNFRGIFRFVFDTHRINASFLGVTWLTYCVIVPVLAALAVVLQTITTRHTDTKAAYKSSVCESYAALLPGLDALIVFLLCCIVLLIEVGEFAELLPLGLCKVASFGIFEHMGLTECMRMDISLGSGFYVLVAAVLLSTILRKIPPSASTKRNATLPI